LDRIADEVQNYDPEIALAIDKVSDQMENRLAGKKDAFDPEKLKDGTYTGDLKIYEDMVENGKLKLPRIKEVTRNFDCSRLRLTSLKGAPEEVGGDFICNYIKLYSLEGAPETVGRDFICHSSALEVLRGAPKKVGGDFICDSNKLYSLEGVPEKVGRNFDCSYNRLKSLKGAPEAVVGDFDCAVNHLESLEGAPKKVGGDFFCRDNAEAFSEKEVEDVCDVKGEIEVSPSGYFY